MTTEVLMKARVSRVLPQRDVDGGRDGEPVRANEYDELVVMTPIRKAHLLAHEGAYFIANNAQTGIAGPAVATFGATTPICVIANTDAIGGRRIFLDYANLVTTAAGSWASAGVNSQLVIVTDAGDRYTSGGTDLAATIFSPNQDAAAKSAIARVRFGNITAAAATGAVRATVGLRILRPAVSATVPDVVGETKYLNFGAVEAMMNGSITIANANNIPIPLPPIIIGPQQCCLIYHILNGTTPGACSFVPEIGWWER
jgi:hypothetical protein